MSKRPSLIISILAVIIFIFVLSTGVQAAESDAGTEVSSSTCVHEMEYSSLIYPNGFGDVGTLTYTCSLCLSESTEEAPAILSSLGYSVTEEGNRIKAANAFSVNTELVAAYEEIYGVDLEIGVFISAAENVSEQKPVSLESLTYFSSSDNVYAFFNYIVTFPGKTSDTYIEYAIKEYVACAFVYDGDIYYFYQDNDESTVSSTLNSGFEATTLITITGEELPEIPDEPEVHVHFSENMTVITSPTKYVSGSSSGVCDECGEEFVAETPYTATNAELSSVGTGYLYTGGKYQDVLFSNLSPLGRALVSSYFRGTNGGYAIDGDYKSFWNADTYVDGANYLNDFIELELPTAYDIGAITLCIPNYSAWGLGEDCYVSYAIEYWDATASQWIYLGTLSDKDSGTSSSTYNATLKLSDPISASKIRARVTHATRFAPAMVYELEVYGKAQDFEFGAVSVAGQANASMSGRYNDWVSGVEATLDGDLTTYWSTDIRNGGPTWALLEFDEEIYIACVQVSVATKTGRKISIEVYENGAWVQIGDTYNATGVLGGNIIANANGITTFNIDVDKTATKIRVNLVSDPEYWTSYVYEITPYTVSSQVNDKKTTKCLHTDLTQGQVVAPTCVSTGYTVMSCSCGVEIKAFATDMLTHSFGAYTVATAATKDTVGTKTSVCSSCGATSTITYESGYEAPVITPYLHDAPAAWAMTFDDGNYTDTYEWVLPQLEKYGYHATALLSVTFSNSLVSTWNEYFNSGLFDLGSHSYNHESIYSGSVNDSALLSDVINAQYWLHANFAGQRILTFAAPNGATSDAVANYLTGPFVANRNGGQGYAFYNVISDLENGRSTWGNLNSYISKKDQTEGEYVYANKNGTVIFSPDESGSYVLNTSYANKGINYVFDEGTMSFVNKGYSAGTYYYDKENYRYDFFETGSYNLIDGDFVFVNDNSGEYKLLKATIGSYESGIDTLVSVGGFTVECIHSLGSGSIYSSYNSTISKFEHLARRGVWAPSYNELVMYLKEAQSATVETIERTTDTLTISVTDNLDNYMFNQALTVKVDIDDSWQNITVTQNGKEITLVSFEDYKASKNMSSISCAVNDGYLYIDVIPDGGDIVISNEYVTLTPNGDGSADVSANLQDILN